MARPQVNFYLDCLSPTSFLGWSVIKRYSKVWDIELKLIPVILGGLMSATNNSPPMLRPWAAAQAKWNLQDLERNKQFFNVPEMQPMPSNFFGPEGPADKTGLSRNFTYMRFVTAVSMKHPDKLFDVIDAVFAMLWTDERDEEGRVLVTKERLRGISMKCNIAEEEADKLIASITSKEVKAKLRSNVEEALELGAFGVPFINIGDHIYFGSDRIEQLAYTHGLPWYGPDPSRPTVAKL